MCRFTPYNYNMRFKVTMTDLDTGEIVGSNNTQFKRNADYSFLKVRELSNMWTESFLRGLNQGKNLHLDLDCFVPKQEEEIFKDAF